MKRKKRRLSPNPKNFNAPPCMNCGEPGPHFAPPGFFICIKKETS